VPLTVLYILYNFFPKKKEKKKVLYSRCVQGGSKERSRNRTGM
jgi:hypothetical protein